MVCVWLCLTAVRAQTTGGVRGTVTDREFNVTLSGVLVTVVEAGEHSETDDTGHFVFQGLKAGTYTLIAAKAGFERTTVSGVVVTPGSLATVDLAMPAEVAAMQEFVVHPIAVDEDREMGADLGAALGAELGAKLAQEIATQLPTEISLLSFRAESAGVVDAVGRDLMSKAGAGSAAEAVKLVAGVTLADDKFAVIRGLSDRFVNTRVNSIIVPTADPDVRAVQLDLFPSALLDSIRVYKTFTPDLPGNTSGGSVDIMTPDPPERLTLEFKVGTAYNTEATGNSKFPTSGQSFDYFGLDEGPREQTLHNGQVARTLTPPRSAYNPANPNAEWQAWLKNARTLERQIRSLSPVMAPTSDAPPPNHSWGLTYGDRIALGLDTSLGWLTSAAYFSKYSYKEGVDHDLISGGRGSPGMTAFVPAVSSSEDPDDLNPDQWRYREGSHTVGWGLGQVFQLKHDEHSLKLNYLRTQQTDEEALDAWDNTTNPNDYWRNQSLIYTARSMESIQLLGTHPIELLDLPSLRLGLDLDAPRLDWSVAKSRATQEQPDRRFFLGAYNPATGRWGTPEAILDFAQRSWREIDEETLYYSADLAWPFALGETRDGRLKGGWSYEDTFRTYTQDTFVYRSNTTPRTPYSSHPGTFNEPWSRVFLEPQRLGYPIFGTGADFSPQPGESNWTIQEFSYDVDYDGVLQVPAYYGMAEVPMMPWLTLVGGQRIEHTTMTTETHAANGDDDRVLVLDVRRWLRNQQNPGTSSIPIGFESPATAGTTLSELADANLEQTDVLPSLGLVLDVTRSVKLRGAWSRTIGRPTFKELSPVSQQDRLGGLTFAGNPTLGISQLENYDVRLEWNPGEGRLLSLSGFRKEIEDPIDYSLRPTQFGIPYVIPFNYPEGEVFGLEFEGRQDLGRLWRPLKGLSLGGSYTWLEATVTLNPREAQRMKQRLVDAKKVAMGIPPLEPAPQSLVSSIDPGERRMKDQPEFIANLYLLYELPRAGTSFALFLNHTGETLVAGEDFSGEEYIPNRLKKPITSLDFSVSQRVSKHGKLSLAITNLLDPVVEEVWQSDYVDQGEATASTYKRGRTISISFSTKW